MTDAAVRAQLRLARSGFAFDVAFAAPARGVTGILGPSGSGKTTLLRCIAGLERDCAGVVRVQGETWQDERAFLPPHRRAVGFVFQDARLFPHLSVRGNLHYGMRRGGAGGVGFDEVVDLLALAPLLHRKPAGLSAGEAQRTAIGRALLRNPRVVLMDEPLANLDVERKQEVLPFLERLHGSLTTPILYVSHSVDEVSRLCDHLVMLQGGRVRGAGSVAEVLAQPELVAAMGEELSTVLDGAVSDVHAEYELTGIDTAAGRLLALGRYGAPGDPLRVRIQARDVSLTLVRPESTTILNVLPAVVAAIAPAPAGHADVTLKVGETTLVSRISRRSCDVLGLQPGLSCYAQVKGVAVKGSGSRPA